MKALSKVSVGEQLIENNQGRNLEHKTIEEEAKLPEVSQGNVCKCFQRSHFLKEAFQVTLECYFSFPPWNSTESSKKRDHNLMKTLRTEDQGNIKKSGNIKDNTTKIYDLQKANTSFRLTGHVCLFFQRQCLPVSPSCSVCPGTCYIEQGGSYLHRNQYASDSSVR